MTPFAETDHAVIAEIEGRETHPIPLTKRRMSLFSQFWSPKTALHQSAISLVDQGVVSATNFFTGVIIARACSKEELGLYALGFSLILTMTDFQSSLIITPYTVYAPRLKGRAHALYTGSTLIHQSAFCVLTIWANLWRDPGDSRNRPQRLRASYVGIGARNCLADASRACSSREFRSAATQDSVCFRYSIAIGQVLGLLVLAHFGLLSANHAYWVIGFASGIAVVGWLWWDRDFYEPRFRDSVADLKKNWALGKWVLASGLIWAIGVNLYPWLLAAYHGVGSTGVWAACMGVVSIGNPVMLGLQNLIGPKSPISMLRKALKL